MKKFVIILVCIGFLLGVLYLWYKDRPKISAYDRETTIVVKSKQVKTTKIPVKIKKLNKTGDIQIVVPKKGTFVLKNDMKKGDVIHVDLQQQFDIIQEKQRQFKVGLYYYPDSPELGFAYQLCTFQDVLDKLNLGYAPSLRDTGFNIGFTHKSPVLTLHRALSHDVDFFVGTTGHVTFGVQVRL